MSVDIEKELADLKKEIQQIKLRNKRVEADKAWETSFLRAVIIVLITYIFAIGFFAVIDQPRPYISAIVPTAGFAISVLSFEKIKSIWLGKHNK
ncbi:hypothetical protein A3F37_01310 [Candidatus Saccharibacteria bacterium RIFCSPHIGHO2_12_FULL_41_12]|nr:MAG: hypothetical protein A3F37_01310 [Candidatus Saccharibacteria bacterium RIFCSPHIGHO2_12_FULL_41_12]